MSRQILTQHDFLNRNDRIKLKGYYFQLWKGHRMKEYHRHERIELMYATEGECSVWIIDDQEGKNEREIRLAQNEMILIDSGIWHKLIVSESCRIINLEFMPERSNYANGSLKEAAGYSPELVFFLKKFNQTAICLDQSNILKVAKLILSETKNASAYKDRGEVLNMYCNLLMIEARVRAGRHVGGRPSFQPDRPIRHFAAVCFRRVVCRKLKANICIYNFRNFPRLLFRGPGR